MTAMPWPGEPEVGEELSIGGRAYRCRTFTSSRCEAEDWLMAAELEHLFRLEEWHVCGSPDHRGTAARLPFDWPGADWWLMLDQDGRIVGAARLAAFENGSGLATAWIYVRPECRRGGVGKALLAMIARAGARSHMVSLGVMTTSAVDGGRALLERLGACPLRSRCEMALSAEGLDRERLAYRAATADRDGLRLQVSRGPYSEDIIWPLMDLKLRVGDAYGQPRIPLWMAVKTFRRAQREAEAHGIERWTVTAHRADQVVGVAEGLWDSRYPEVLGDLVVAAREDVALCGFGAASARLIGEVLEARPSVNVVRCSVLSTHTGLLALMTDLGYLVHHTRQEWSVSMEAVTAYLGG